MKRIAMICSWVMIIGIAGVITFAGTADTIYNKQGQAVQAFAPNYFQNISTTTTVDLSDTLYFEMESTTDGKMFLTSDGDKTGEVAITVTGGERRGYGKGYGIGFVTYSGCTGVHSSMRGDWTQQ